MAFGRKREPYTPCKLYVDGIFDLREGQFLSTGKSAYLVQGIRQSPTRRARRYLSCIRWPIAEIPASATVYELSWYKRPSKRARA